MGCEHGGSQVLDAHNNCSLRVAVWGTACIKAPERVSARVQVRLREKERAAWRELMWLLFVTEGLLVVFEDAHLFSAPSSMHIPQHWETAYSCHKRHVGKF